MELRHLRSFCAVVKHQGVSRAAAALGLGQPTVTTHVRKLERELGMVLFDRVRRPIQPTLAGAKLAELAAPLVEGVDALAVRAAEAEETGPVSVASTPDIIPHALLQPVRTFRTLHPHVQLRILSGHRPDVLRMVADGEVDLGLLPDPERSPEFDFQSLFPYDRVLITPKGHPLLEAPLDSLDQIAAWPLIVMGPRGSTRLMLETEFQRKGLAYEIVAELDTMDMIKRYVALGLGISVGPSLAIGPEDEESLGVVDLGHMLPIEQTGIVTLRGKTLSAPARNFIAVVERTLGQRVSPR